VDYASCKRVQLSHGCVNGSDGGCVLSYIRCRFLQSQSKMIALHIRIQQLTSKACVWNFVDNASLQ
jgi:hypothetical protein